MSAANTASAPAYGDDEWTARAADAFRTLFETDCEVFFAFNGTAATSLALAALCQSYHSVICSSSSHVETDECGAPEFFYKIGSDWGRERECQYELSLGVAVTLKKK